MRRINYGLALGVENSAVGFYLFLVLRVLLRRGVIQLTRGVGSSVWSGLEPNHGSVTARVEASIS